jgi:putative transposase
MIRKENTKLSLTRQCKLLKISRSSIYYTPVGVNAKTLKLIYEIDRVCTKIPILWEPPNSSLFAPVRVLCGSSRVRRLMGIMGLQAIYKGPNTNKEHPEHRIYP